jgi:hypothetical protein
MVYLGEGVESVTETPSFCCITRLHIKDHNAPCNAIYTTIRFKCKSVFSIRTCYANVLEENPVLSVVNIWNEEA